MKSRKLLAAVSALLVLAALSGCAGIRMPGGESDWPENEYSEDELIEVTTAGDVSAPIDINAPVTEEALLSFAKMYDNDAYIILNEIYRNDKSYSIIDYYEPDKKIPDEFDVSVHEMCHATNSISNDKFKIYVGNGEWAAITVKDSDYFTSDELVDYIDEKYRTYRFDTYINGEKDIGSVVNGCFGLLDEFSAYCWGTKAVLGTYTYVKDMDPASDDFSYFIFTYFDKATSYTEFKFYILSYLLYAKETYPDKYEKIMNNADFLYAYNKIDDAFTKVLNTYNSKITEYINENDNVTIKDGYFAVTDKDLYCELETEGYELLAEKLAEPAYAEMDELMKSY